MYGLQIEHRGGAYGDILRFQEKLLEVLTGNNYH